jgi:phytoene dehydrogenase-like protein
VYRDIGAIDDHTQVINHDVFAKLVDQEYGDFYLYTDMDRWEAYLKELAPEDSKGIHKLCSMIKRTGKVEDFKNPPGMRSIGDYLKVIIKNWRVLPLLDRYVKRTTKELFDDLGLQNEKLRHFLGVISMNDAEHDSPGIVLLMILGWQHEKNAGYLMGGSGAMTSRIAETYTKLGGQIKFNSKVKTIVVEDDMAKAAILEDGQQLKADHIISACDGHTVLYDMLGGKYLPPAVKKAYEEWPTFKPLVFVSLGINKIIEPVSHETWYTDKIQIGRTEVLGYRILIRTMYDKTLAPEGKSTLELYFQSPWETWEALSDTEYAQEKEAIQKCCMELLEEKYPGISEHIQVVDLATPRTTNRFTGVWKGAFEGFQPLVGEIGSFLPMELDGLKNFSMAGQWVTPGGGLPPSALSGRWAIQKIAKADKKKFQH